MTSGGTATQDSRPISQIPTLARIAELSGRSQLALAWETFLLRHGPGKLSRTEYMGLRLFDPSIPDKPSFVGFHAAQKIWMQANFRADLFGLVNNKLASDILFAAHGFPVLQTVALFRQTAGLHGGFLIRTPQELRQFLIDTPHYPLFGKPISGHQSLGSTSIDHYDAARNCLITTTGHPLSLDAFMSYVSAQAGSGYLFQRRAAPHQAVREICGDRLATVRLLTIVTNGQAKLHRACWKIPAGTNVADNFWRSGNLLAQLDLQTGQILGAMRQTGDRLEQVTHHPETGASLIGISVPNWQEVTRLALEACKVIDGFALVGWDIAPTDDGAVLVELNETPDFRLHQLSDRRGIMDDAFKVFLAERKRISTDWFNQVKTHQRGQ